MRSLTEKEAMQWSLMALIDGLALWFFAVLFAAYQFDRIQSGSITDLLPVIEWTMNHWLVAPGLTLPELVGYVGLVIALLGPLVIILMHSMAPIGGRQEHGITDGSHSSLESDESSPVLKTDGAITPDEPGNQYHRLIQLRDGSSKYGASAKSSPITGQAEGSSDSPTNGPIGRNDPTPVAMNPFKSEPEPSDEPSPDTREDTEESTNASDEIKEAVDEYQETASVVIDVDDNPDDYVELEVDKDEAQTEHRANSDPFGELDLRDRIEVTEERLEGIQTGLSIISDAKSRSDEVIDRLPPLSTESGAPDALLADIDTAQKTVQEIRITMGQVKPSYPSFIATDIANSSEDAADIERSLRRMSDD